jgi:hypothetical protein
MVFFEHIYIYIYIYGAPTQLLLERAIAVKTWAIMGFRVLTVATRLLSLTKHLLLVIIIIITEGRPLKTRAVLRKKQNFKNSSENFALLKYYPKNMFQVLIKEG